MKQIDKLIINSPYEEPKYCWHYDREHRSFEKREGRRPAGYVVATPDSKGFDDPGVFVPIELVNKIRPRVKSWRENDYPGIINRKAEETGAFGDALYIYSFQIIVL